jgi:hypothetical protein
MENNRKYIPCEQIESIKDACRTMYKESRRFPGTLEQKDMYLNTIMGGMLKKASMKVIQEENNLEKDLEEVYEGYLFELKELMEEWSEEFSLQYNVDAINNSKTKNSGWKIWKKLK